MGVGDFLQQVNFLIKSHFIDIFIIQTVCVYILFH